MTDGIINIRKEKGYTSHDVVAKLRGILKIKKIGHTGTLDPDAEGVLPVCIGKGTKLCDLLTEKDKEYQAVLLLGVETDTQDITGNILGKREVNVSPAQVEEVILSFKGSYDQIPPMYSAVRVGGKRLYELAREGKEIERRPRRVEIFEIRIDKIELPKVVFHVRCSKGTYIRTLCHDIGEKLGCKGCMESLVRTRVERFCIQDALTLAQVEEARDKGTLSDYVIPVDEMFSGLEAFYGEKELDRLLHNGNSFHTDRTSDDRIRVYDSQGRFVGLYEREGKNCYRPLKMFWGG